MGVRESNLPFQIIPDWDAYSRFNYFRPSHILKISCEYRFAPHNTNSTHGIVFKNSFVSIRSELWPGYRLTLSVKIFNTLVFILKERINYLLRVLQNISKIELRKIQSNICWKFSFSLSHLEKKIMTIRNPAYGTPDTKFAEVCLKYGRKNRPANVELYASLVGFFLACTISFFFHRRLQNTRVDVDKRKRCMSPRLENTLRDIRVSWISCDSILEI